MKKIVLAAIAVLTFGWVNAQEVKFGIKGSLAWSNFSGDTDGVDVKSKIGFNAGGFAEIKLSEKFSIQPEILYSLQGAKIENIRMNLGNDIVNTNIDFNLSYINIPVMFKYYVYNKISLEAGPQVGFLVSAKGVAKVDGYSGNIKDDAKDSFKSLDFGLNIGAGYDITDHLSVGLRFNSGLANIAKNEPGYDFKLNNNVVSLVLVYKF